MPDEKPPDDGKPEQTPKRSESFPLKPAGEVVVTHLDAPPPSGKREIHQRRPLPQVPDRRPLPQVPDRRPETSDDQTHNDPDPQDPDAR